MTKVSGACIAPVSASSSAASPHRRLWIAADLPLEIGANGRFVANPGGLHCGGYRHEANRPVERGRLIGPGSSSFRRRPARRLGAHNRGRLWIRQTGDESHSARGRAALASCKVKPTPGEGR
jgi:hypothetical protein